MRFDINLDIKRNEIVFILFFISMIILALYNVIVDTSSNIYFNNFLFMVALISVSSSCEKNMETKKRNIFRIVCIASLLTSITLQNYFNMYLLILPTVLGIYFLLRGLGILNFKRTNMETGEYYYL